MVIETLTLEGLERMAEVITGATGIEEEHWYHHYFNLNQLTSWCLNGLIVDLSTELADNN